MDPLLCSASEESSAALVAGSLLCLWLSCRALDTDCWLQSLPVLLAPLLFSMSSLYKDSSLSRRSLLRISLRESEVRKVAAFLIFVVVTGDDEEVVMGESRDRLGDSLPESHRTEEGISLQSVDC